jgi:hypothetical protein
MVLRHDSRKTGIEEPEDTAITRQRPINTFPLQKTRDAKIWNCWKQCFLLGSSQAHENVRE